MEPALTLVNTPFDLQITICIFLHPSDILALRKTCKALELATRKRIVWLSALRRVCLDNTLFLPSFPILDMSDLELERAALAPRRWIDAIQKEHSNDFKEMPHPRTTRVIEDAANSHSFIVPGGRYLVTAGKGLFVWDLGYVSTVDSKLVASVGLGDDFEFLDVQATQDGKGLVILTSYRSLRLSIFEIYPQSEIPLLTEIAYLHLISSEEFPGHLLPDTLICFLLHENRVVFRVVDYRTNYSTLFSADFDTRKNTHIKTFATKTAIMFFCMEEILIWAIPPLSPRSSDFRHFLENNSIHLPPLLNLPFPGGILRDIPIFGWMAVNSWYFGSPAYDYFDILYEDSILQRFKIIIEPDLSDGSLHFVNMSEFISDDLMKLYRVCGYRICEDAFVYFWNNCKTWGAYTGLTSAPFKFTNVVTQWNGHIDSLCPSSGRYVYRTYDGDGNIGRSIVVVDLF